MESSAVKHDSKTKGWRQFAAVPFAVERVASRVLWLLVIGQTRRLKHEGGWHGDMEVKWKDCMAKRKESMSERRMLKRGQLSGRRVLARGD